MLTAQASLKGIPVPAFASGRDVIRELDPLMLERFATPPPEELDDVTKESVAEDVPDEPLETVSFEQEVGLAMEQLARAFGNEEAVAPVASAGPSPDGPSPAGITADPRDERFESLFGAGGEVVVGRAARGRGGPTRAGQTGLQIGIDQRVAGDEEIDRVEIPTGPDVAVETGAARPDATGNEVAIGVFEAESFDGSEVDRLAAWMRDHRAELPVGVRIHMNYESSFLTAVAPFSSDGRNWELFLMLNESLPELHIVLVEGNSSVYLIDREFQEQSRSLREGTVRRDGGVIVAVDSRAGSASGERAQDFYNVFLSWWDVVRADAGAN